MSLSIIIPVFNEVKLLPQILRKVIQATPLIDKEISKLSINNKLKDLNIGEKLEEEKISKLIISDLFKISVNDNKKLEALSQLKDQYNSAKKDIQERFEDKVLKIRQGDDLLPSVMKMVKIFVAVKRKLQPGDKMAGRHGNKGVISKIVPIEDMPYIEDGTHVDILLNPLGVPSRMNVGQILETHLGWACVGLGKKIGKLINDYKNNNQKKELYEKLQMIYGDDFTKKLLDNDNSRELDDLKYEISDGISISTPVFDGAKESDINIFFEKTNLDSAGQVKLIDGRRGDYFDRKITYL